MARPGGGAAPARVVDKQERQINLVLVLLNTTSPLPLSRLRKDVPGYDGGADAVRQKFERDKRELRTSGIEIRSVPIEGDDQVGYRIDPSSFWLPDFGLDDDEARALGARRGDARLRRRRGRAGAARRPARDARGHARLAAGAPLPLPSHRRALRGLLRAQGQGASGRAGDPDAPRATAGTWARSTSPSTSPGTSASTGSRASRGSRPRAPRPCPRTRLRRAARGAALGDRPRRGPARSRCTSTPQSRGPSSPSSPTAPRPSPRRRLGRGHGRLGPAGPRAELGAVDAAPRRGPRAAPRPRRGRRVARRRSATPRARRPAR